MGVAAGDFDDDGDGDIFISHLTKETNTLYVNGGAGMFRDLTNRFNLGAPSSQLTGFATTWLDFDHNAALDLFVANGGVTTMESQRGSDWLQVRLHGVEDNRDAMEARVALLSDDGAAVAWRRAHSDGSYLSASSLDTHFGLPAGSAPTWVGCGMA